MGNLENLEVLNLGSNQLTGHFFRFLGWSVPYDQPNRYCFVPPYAAGIIPESLGNLGKLKYLYLQDNRFSGHFFFIFGMVIPVRPICI